MKRLGSTTVKAATWLYALRMSDRLFGLATTVILARLLTPKDFGVVAIGTLIVGIFEVFSRTGLQHALIQADEVSSHELHAVWSFELGRGILLAALMFFGAPLMAAFFRAPDAIPILRAMSCVPILMFIMSAEYTLLLKEISYRQIFIIDTASTVIRAATGIWLALTMRNVWALCISIIAGFAARSVASFIVPRVWPRLVWDFRVIRKHFRYGRQIMAAAAGEYVYRQADSWFVGRVMGPALLGLYNKAYQLGELPTTQLVDVLQRILFPSFAKLQHDRAALRQAFLRVQEVLALAVAPLSVSLAILAQPFVLALLGKQWVGMIPAFQILAIWGGTRAFYQPAASLFRAVGKPAVVTYTTVLKIAMMATLFWPMKRFGITGIAIVILLTAVVELPIMFALIARELQVSQRTMYRPMLLPALAAAAAGIAGLALQPTSWGAGARLALGVTLTGAGFIGIMLLASLFLGMNQLPTAVRLVRQRLKPAGAL